jgi:hypothetical protein
MHKNLHCLTRIFCALILISSAIPSHAQADGEPVVIGKKIQIHSRVLSETRFLFIAKPAGYDEEPERYPVLYLLDGDEDNFVQVTGIVQFLAASERIPPLLVVGVANTDRTHDLTPSTEVETEIRFHPKNGGANMFLQFVSNELIPYVDQHYRTRPYKILIGHSLGGCLPFTLWPLTLRFSTLISLLIHPYPGITRQYWRKHKALWRSGKN